MRSLRVHVEQAEGKRSVLIVGIVDDESEQMPETLVEQCARQSTVIREFKLSTKDSSGQPVRVCNPVLFLVSGVLRVVECVECQGYWG